MPAEKPDLANQAPDPERTLESCSMCAGLGKEFASEIAKLSRMAFAERGSLLWVAGSSANYFAVIASGILLLSRNAPQGKEIVVEILGPGECAGILATYSESAFPLTAHALTDVWILKVPNRPWLDLLDEHPALLKQAVRELTPRLLRGFDFMATMLSGAVEQRMAMCLLRLAEIVPAEPEHRRRVLPITRQNLAEISCTTVESAIRTTTKWQRQGWIDASRGSIEVVDPAALGRLLEPAYEP